MSNKNKMAPAAAQAGTAEILRAAQRDELVVEKLQQQVSDILLQSLGNVLWMKYRIPFKIVSELVYYILTTLSNNQTIGEEYTGIIQVDSTGRQLPSKQLRLLMILCGAVAPTALSKLVSLLEEKLRKPSSLTPRARASLLEILGATRSSFDFVKRLHKAVFYWGGSFYDISKHLTGIQYVLVRRWMKDYETQPSFRLLSTVMLFHLLGYSSVKSAAWLRDFPSTLSKTETTLSSLEDIVASGDKPSSVYRCSLCLEERKNDTATTCGHVFCWSCIAQWLQTRAQCPLCREPLEASRLIPLQNYRLKS